VTKGRACGGESSRGWFNVKYPCPTSRPKAGFVLAIACLLLASGCAPHFRYAPGHDATYSVIEIFRGVQIERDATERVAKAEGEISWSKSDSQIIANALADELKHAKLFRRVDIVKVADPTRRQDKYSHVIRFDIRKFRLSPRENLAQSAGRAALKSRGRHGYFIDKGIPREWVAEVEIEFELRDASGGGRSFTRKYSATPGSVTVRGYSDGKEERQQMSEALEEVVKAFVADVGKSVR
jgi:hypothetical protein